MFQSSEIERRLKESLPGCEVTVTDLTGTQDHYHVQVVSEKFEGLSLIEQHRLVYAPFEGDVGGELHALSIKTKTP